MPICCVFDNNIIMNIENIGEELSNLVDKFELTKTCLHISENQEAVSVGVRRIKAVINF